MATATDTTTIVPADIIIVIDSSQSMGDEIVLVQTFMNAFSQQISAAGVDPRVILIGDPQAICIGAPLGTGMCPADENLPTYVRVAGARPHRRQRPLHERERLRDERR